MKNLKNYCVRVTTAKEKQIAVDFYKRATHRSSQFITDRLPIYIGMCPPHEGRYVCDGSLVLPNETVLEFHQMIILADTPARKAIFDKLVKMGV